MTDLDQFLALYESFGIKLDVELDPTDGSRHVAIHAHEHPKLDGHNCFYSSIIFDADGRFVSQAFWE